jgi:hypothetical protein
MHTQSISSTLLPLGAPHHNLSAAWLTLYTTPLTTVLLLLLPLLLRHTPGRELRPVVQPQARTAAPANLCTERSSSSEVLRRAGCPLRASHSELRSNGYCCNKRLCAAVDSVSVVHASAAPQDAVVRLETRQKRRAAWASHC